MLTKNQGMLDTEDSWLQCVNPHEVNPILGPTDNNKLPTEYRLHFNVANIPVAGIFDPRRRVKSEEMEEFKDLSVFLPTTPANAIDELNTPVFEQNAFDFTHSPVKSSPFDYKFDQELFDNLYSQQQQQANTKDLNNRLLQQQQPESSDINIESHHQQNNELPIYLDPTSGNSNEIVYQSDCDSPPYEPVSHNNSVQSFTDLKSAVNICTPEDSNSSQSGPSPTALFLNINLNPLAQANMINTPDIINTVADMDNNFNILDIVQADDITTVNVEDIFPSTNNTNTNSSSSSTNKTQQQQTRRRRHVSYDSDDEYVPPTKSAKYPTAECSSDSDSDYEVQPTKKRGRTRKTPSVTSTDSRTDNVRGKYREIRDKNNEASRKSRLKRKQKEMEIEKECDGLVERNLKLKAQVEELEKTVNSYRNNLFSIMMKK